MGHRGLARSQAASSLVLVCLLAGCHPPPPRRGDGGPLVVLTDPVDGATGLGRRPVLRVVYDRPISPRGLEDGDVLLRSGDRSLELFVSLDPATRTLEVRPVRALDPEIDYRLEVAALPDLDGEESEPLVVHFSTGRDTTAVPLPSATYEEVAPILSICGRCHGGAEPTMGMDLSSPEGIALTALSVPAREVRSSGEVGASALGLIGLSRIDPGRPERSYLLYKVLGDPHVVGERMPYRLEPLDAAAIDLLVAWIRAGAPGPVE